MSPSQSAISGWGWGFNRADIDPNHHRFRTQLVGCTCMEGVLTQGCDLILSGCGRTSNEPVMGPNPLRVQLGTFPPAARASPPYWRYGGFYDPGIGSYPLRVAMALRAPANQRSANVIRVSTSCGAVSTRGTPVFVPGVSEL